jgi:hypothetical protein
VGDAGIHQLLLGNVPQDDLDHVFSFCDALGTNTEEYAQVVLQGEDGFQDLQ